MAKLLVVLAVVLVMVHSYFFSTTKTNITSLERSCLDPNEPYNFPSDTAYGISIFCMGGYNLVSFFLVLRIYVYLLNEEKEATIRKRQHFTVSTLFPIFSCCHGSFIPKMMMLIKLESSTIL